MKAKAVLRGAPPPGAGSLILRPAVLLFSLLFNEASAVVGQRQEPPHFPLPRGRQLAKDALGQMQEMLPSFCNSETSKGPGYTLFSFFKNQVKTLGQIFVPKSYGLTEWRWEMNASWKQFGAGLCFALWL